MTEMAIEEGWAELAGPIDFTDTFLLSAKVGVRRIIANADDHPEDDIERADTALAGTIS